MHRTLSTAGGCDAEARRRYLLEGHALSRNQRGCYPASSWLVTVVPLILFFTALTARDPAGHLSLQRGLTSGSRVRFFCEYLVTAFS
jgi:hypothetical protein